jgi:hypothetical protein
MNADPKPEWRRNNPLKANSWLLIRIQSDKMLFAKYENSNTPAWSSFSSRIQRINFSHPYVISCPCTFKYMYVLYINRLICFNRVNLHSYKQDKQLLEFSRFNPLWIASFLTFTGGGRICPLARVRTGASPPPSPTGLCITVIHLVSTFTNHKILH